MTREEEYEFWRELRDLFLEQDRQIAERKAGR